jgi:hypothetical protein
MTDTDIAALVDRLRALRGWYTEDDIRLHLDAADALEALQAENERLREAVLPVEPTEEMLAAIWETIFDDAYNGTQAPAAGAAYDALRAVALAGDKP